MNTPASEKEWFADWFNSPYYHVLYRHRSQEEAAAFIHPLAAHIGMPAGSRVLDLACGKGRHSRILHELGMQVTGIDLSPENILEAQQYEAPGLEFYVHDMRRPFRVHYFDFVFNLFTSFGYFCSENENRQVLSAVRQGLRPGGKLVIDFFNGEKVRSLLQQPYSMETTAGGIVFHIRKHADATHVYKAITFSDQGRDTRLPNACSYSDWRSSGACSNRVSASRTVSVIMRLVHSTGKRRIVLFSLHL